MPDTPIDHHGTLLGFDYGHKRLGIAVGQTITRSASPVMTMDVSNGIDWQKIGALIEEWRPAALIVGLPLTADGQETPLLSAIQKFMRRLEGRFRLPVHGIDEHLSSHTAKDLLNSASPRRIAPLDAAAAAVILQTWLEQHVEA